MITRSATTAQRLGDWVRRHARRIDKYFPEFLELVEDHEIGLYLLQNRHRESGPKSAHQSRRAFAFGGIGDRFGVHLGKLYVLVLGQRIDETALELANAHEVFMPFERPGPTRFASLIALTFGVKCLRIE